MFGSYLVGISTYITYDVGLYVPGEDLYGLECEGATVSGGSDTPVWETMALFFCSASAAHANGVVAD